MRIEKLKRTYDVEVKLVHFPLHPETPAEGITLEELFGTRGGGPEERARRQAEMKARMDAEGLPYGSRTHTYNSRLAQELGAWAETQPGAAAIHDALYKAYFVEGRNIGDVDELVAIAEAVGLDGARAREALETRAFKDQVDADWVKSREYGVTGVPTFVARGYGVVGAQPYEVLEQLMDTAGARRRPQ